jgi:predicted GNAT family acetyltransferase
MNIHISTLTPDRAAPMELLLLADPSEELVNSYLAQGTCFIAECDGHTVGVALMMETKPGTIEIMNIAVKPELHNQGIGKKLLLHVIDEIKKGDTKTIEIGTGNRGGADAVVSEMRFSYCRG